MIRGVLFDMDGVLFDTEALGIEAMRQIGTEMGYNIDKAFYLTTLGFPNSETIHIYRRAFGDDFPYDEVMRRFKAFYSKYNQNGSIPRKPGLMECLTGLKERGLKIALATSTKRPLVTEYFAAMPDIAACFDALVCGGEVPNGKPAPDIYVAAASAVGCTPGECIGVEDSFSGVRAIRASGANCVMIPDLLPFTTQFAPYVDHCLESLHKLCPLVDTLNKTIQ